MERPIKTASTLVPKMFKTFAIYIFMTLAVFYGYIQIYGNVSNDNGLASTNPGQAEDDTFFGNFVDNLMTCENINTDISFSVDNADLFLELDGNVAFDINTTNLYLNLNLSYQEKTVSNMSVSNLNEQNSCEIFKVVATYTAPYLYLNLGENYYKFDCQGEFDFSFLANLLKENVYFNENSLGGLLQQIGLEDIDLDALIADAMEQLKQEPTQDAQGNYRLFVTLKNIIKAHLVCDSNYNLISVRLDNGTIIKGNAITFEAQNIKMNNNAQISFDETDLEIVDMSGLTQYLTYAQNLFNEKYVVGEISIEHNNQNYIANLIVDKSTTPKILLQTNYQGLNISLAYANEEIYLDINNLKLKFCVSDYNLWVEKLTTIVENQTSKDIAAFIKDLLKKYANIDLDNIDFSSSLLQILAGGEESQNKLASMLPEKIEVIDNRYILTYENGINLTFISDNQKLASILLSYPNFSAVANFSVTDQGFEVGGDYFDLTKLLPMADLVDQILSAQAFGGKIILSINNEKIVADYLVGLHDKFVVKLSAKFMEETVEIFISEESLFVKVGDFVIQGVLSEIESYLLKIDSIFNTNYSNSFGQQFTAQEIVSYLSKIFTELSMCTQEGSLAVVQYLSYIGNLKVQDDSALIEIINDKFEIALTVTPSQQTIEALPIAQETVNTVLNKIEYLTNLIEGKKLATTFKIEYKNICLTGTINIDLQSQVFDIKINNIGQNKLNIIYKNDIVYVNYAGNKIKVEKANFENIINILKPIIQSNFSNVEELSLSAILTKIFGEDVSKLPIKDILNKLTLNLTTDLQNMLSIGINGRIESEIAREANVNINFVDEKLVSVDISALDLSAEFVLTDYVEPIVDENYLNLLSTFSGNLNLNLNKEISISADVVVDLTDKIYLNASFKLFNENVCITILNNDFFVAIGEIKLHADFNNATQLFDYIVQTFNVVLPEKANLTDILNELDLNNFNPVTDVLGLNWHVDQNGIFVKYNNEKVQINLTLQENVEQIIGNLPDIKETETLQSVLTKVVNIKNLIEGKVIEGDYTFSYNGWAFAGTIKYFADDLKQVVEIVVKNVCGNSINIRLQNNTLYLAYGNMKYKYEISQNNTSTFNLQEILTKITSETFGVVIDFGEFTDIIKMLRDYSIEDYFKYLILSVSGNTNQLEFVIKNKVGAVESQLAYISTNFENDVLNNVSLNIRNILTANLNLHEVTSSTITEFNEDEYVEYTTNLVDAMLDSIKYQQNVYAFGGDIAIRYSTNTFKGELVAMLVKEDGYEGFIKNYKPAISLHTDALGLNTFVYLIDQTIYLDLNGLRLYADVNSQSINEIIDFVETNFLPQTSEAKQLANDFRVVLPAITQIYGMWLDGGIRLDINGELYYSENANLSNMVVQVEIASQADLIVPTQIIFGANITDLNTSIYDSYEGYWLDGEELFTKSLNFAVYLNNIVSGNLVGDLEEIFIPQQSESMIDFSVIEALKSNAGSSKLEDFNNYKIVLDAVQAVLDYGKSMQFSFDISATISGASTTNIDGQVVATVTEDTENKAQFELFDNKLLKVQGDLNINAQNIEHKISLLYDNFDAGLFATYSHGDFINQNKEFKAKIANSNISDIVSLICAFANIKMSEEMMNLWNLSVNKTDFSYLKSLIGIQENQPTEITTADSILAMVTDLAKFMESLTINKTAIENGKQQTVLTLTLDLNDDNLYADKQLSTISIIFNEENSGQLKLHSIVADNIIVGENKISFTLNIVDFDASQFNYNTSAQHIDISDISSFLDIAVNTLNTKGFNFSGETSISIIGLDVITVQYDLFVSLDDAGELYFYLEVDVPSFMGATYDSGGLGNTYTYYSALAGFDNRISVLEYQNETLTVTQTTYGYRKLATDNRETKVKTWTHNASDIGKDIMQILAETLGLTDKVYEKIADLIKNMNPNPSLEETILGFEKINDGYILSLDGETLTGDSNFGDIAVTLGISNTYTNLSGDNYQFIDSITANINIANGAVIIPLNLNSVNNSASYLTGYGTQLNTNDYYRKIYVDNARYNVVTFKTYCNNAPYDSLLLAPGETIVFPTLTTKQTTVDNITTYYEFEGWYEDVVFSIPVTSNVMKDQDMVFYAKWKPVKVAKTVGVNIYDGETLLTQIRALAGEPLDLTEYEWNNVDTKYYKDPNYTTEYESLVVPEEGMNIYIRNKYKLTYIYYENISGVHTQKQNTIQLYQGEVFSLPSQSNYYIDYYNSSNVLSHRTFYNYSGYFYNGELLTSNVMTNTDMYIESNLTETTKNWYKIVFDVELRYIPYRCTVGNSYKTAPTAPASIMMLEGDTLNLNNSTYRITCTCWATAASWGLSYSYTATGWDVTVPDNYQNGGGKTSITINSSMAKNGVITLYPYWEK